MEHLIQIKRKPILENYTQLNEQCFNNNAKNVCMNVGWCWWWDDNFMFSIINTNKPTEIVIPNNKSNCWLFYKMFFIDFHTHKTKGEY